MSKVFRRKQFSNYLGEQRAIDDIISEYVPDPSFTPTPTPSLTPTNTPTPSITPSVTPTLTPSITPSVTLTPSVTPSVSPTPSITPSVTQTITPTSTLTPTPTPSLCVLDPLAVPNLLAWYDLQDPTTITSSGTTLLAINDKSVNGYNLSNPIGLVEYVPSTLPNFSTKMSAYFSGASSLNASLPSILIPAGSTMFAVFGKKTTNGTMVQISTGTTFTPFTTDHYGLHNIGNNGRVNTNGRTTTLTCSLTNGDSVIIGASGDNSGLTDNEINRPGLTCSAIGVTATGTSISTFTDLRIGSSGTNSIEILEIAVYDGIITSNQFDCIMNYFRNKYNYSTWV